MLVTSRVARNERQVNSDNFSAPQRLFLPTNYPWLQALSRAAIAVYAAGVLLFVIVLPAWSQTTNTTTMSADRITKLLATDKAMSTALPAPADDPLMDSSGHVVTDAHGNPESDPKEGFHRVTPQDFDPGHTFLVEAGWLDGLGCVTSGFTATPNADFTAWSGSTAPYSEPACPTGDAKDEKNEGLLLVKTGPDCNELRLRNGLAQEGQGHHTQ